MAPQYWLFWDGSCGFCQRAVAWIKRRDTANRIRAVPYQDAPRPPMTDELAHRCTRAVHVLTPQGELLAAGRASLCVLSLIGYARLARVCSVPPLVWCVELGYWLVARNRRFFSLFLFCPPHHKG
jgi:predicted DCC family thiol-disulfide oxidoreductase YuxK